MVTSATFSALVDDSELWADVNIVTLREWAMSQARDVVTEQANTIYDLTPLTIELANTKFNIQRAFVRVDPDRITVGVNADTIDEAAISSATIMLVTIQDFNVIAQYCFGKEVNVSTDIE